MKTAELSIQTGRRRGLFDLTDSCEKFVAGEGDGLLVVFVPHATAGIVVVELGAGSDADLMGVLDRLLPRDHRWAHRHGSPGHGADHLVPMVAPPSLTVPVVSGRLTLGTWQQIIFIDFDNRPRQRELILQIIGE